MAGSAGNLGFNPSIIGDFGTKADGLFEQLNVRRDERQQQRVIGDLDLSNPASLDAYAERLMRAGDVQGAMQARAQARQLRQQGNQLQPVSANAARQKQAEMQNKVRASETEGSQRAERAEALRVAGKPNEAKSVLQGHMTIGEADRKLDAYAQTAADDAETLADETAEEARRAELADKLVAAGMPDHAKAVRDGDATVASGVGALESERAAMGSARTEKNENAQTLITNLQVMERGNPRALAMAMRKFGISGMKDIENLSAIELERFAAFSSLSSFQNPPADDVEGAWKLDDATGKQEALILNDFDSRIEAALEDTNAEGNNYWLADEVEQYDAVAAQFVASLGKSYNIADEQGAELVVSKMEELFKKNKTGKYKVHELVRDLDAHFSKGDPRRDTAVKISTQAEFDALPKGAVYIDPDDGKEYRKQ